MYISKKALDWAGANKDASLAEAYQSGLNARFETENFPTPEQLDEMRAAYVAGGASLKDLAAQYEQTPNRIRRELGKQRITKRVKWDSENIKDVIEHFDLGRNVEALAEKYKTTEIAIKSAYYKYKKKDND